MIPKDLNVCVLPFNIIWDDVESNIENFKRALRGVHPQTDLLVLPETFITGFPIDKNNGEIISIIRPFQEKILELLYDAAKQYSMAICGSFIIETSSKNVFNVSIPLNKSNPLSQLNEGDSEISNSAFFIEPSGEIYISPKTHLFSLAGENKIFKSNKEKMIVRYRGWNIAIAVCYDLRFPVWSRNRNNEYDLLIYVANWPEVRVGAWDKLLPARAIENLSYVIGVNCRGFDNKGNRYNGSSVILDYKGNTLSSFVEEKEVETENISSRRTSEEETTPLIYAKLSADKLINFRKKFPAWQDADNFTLLP